MAALEGGGRQGRGRSGGGRRHEDAPAAGSGGNSAAAGRSAAQATQQPAAQHPHEGVLGSSPGRRGFLNANHLLGFQPSRREGEGRGGGGGGRSGGRGGRGGGGRGPPRRPSPKPQPYDRNKFLQANFRFLVSNAVDARRFQRDPDLMLEWEDVVQVEMLSAQPVRCPITLDERPFCPQITPCGHVFSFPAIVGHLVNHGGPELRKSAPCPLCYTQIAARELRLVQVHRVEAPEAGQLATFQLLRRPRDSIIPQEVGGGPVGCPRATAGSAAAAGSGGGAQSAAVGSPGKGRQPAGKQAPAGGGDEAGKPAWRAAAGGSSANAVGGSIPGPAAGSAGAAAGAAGAAANRFCKFTLVGDATPLYVAEAQRLAQHAAQVTAEGGLEAAYEAPNLYSAIDALAARARAAAERRQRLLLEAADPMAQDALLSPEEVGAQAAAAVKGATTAALSAAAVQRERAAAAAAREEAFPSLAATAGGPQRSAAAPPARPRPPPPAAEAGAQPAFSDDEGDTGHGQAPAPAGPRQPATAAVAIADRAAAGAPAAGGHGDGSPGPTAGPDGAATELSSSVRSAGGGMLGSSPGAGGAGGQGGDGQAAGDFYFYQAADGQWLFLCALNLRMLLARYGSYAACPPTFTAKVLEVEDVAQDEASRRRMRVLAHLPLTATFKLCEVDLSALLPPEALAPFAEELAQREKRRVQRAKQEARRLRQERAAAAAAAAAAANTGLSAAELRAMPLPAASLLPAGLERQVEEDAAVAAAAAGEGEAAPDEPPATPPQPGVSFARIARDGFAATGPSLSAQAANAAPSPAGLAAAAPPAPRGVWGAPKPAAGVPAAPSGVWGAAATGSAAAGEAGAAAQQLAGLQVSSGKGGKGKGKVVLFGAPQRKY
ncbi:hypothetical protein ABPG75_010292 [Micractinium tetrahymenae]